MSYSQQRFLQLDNFLLETENIWRCQPFFDSQNESLPWQQQYPELCHFLQSLSLTSIQNYQEQLPLFIEDLNAVFPMAKHALELCDLPLSDLPLSDLPLSDLPLSDLPLSKSTEKVSGVFNLEIIKTEKISSGIKGRKWQQISAFSALAKHYFMPQQWLEWCAGKGYLGQLLYVTSDKTVVSLERDPALCQSGQKLASKNLASKNLASKNKVQQIFIEQDVLDKSALNHLHNDQHVVALHACGDLHFHLIEQCPNKSVAALSVAPCCYHLTQAEQYLPLSVLAQKSVLVLNKKDLRMAVQETVTGGARVRQHRETEMIYRLALDIMLREQYKLSQYVPIPSVKKSQLSQGFKSFCEWADSQKSLNLKDIPNWQDEKLLEIWLEKGTKRFVQMERLNLVQSVFKRPLELWLALDKTLYLEEHGYQTSLRYFVDKAVTPRNILIQAKQLVESAETPRPVMPQLRRKED